MRVINLLPPSEQQLIKLERINGYFKRFLVLVIVSFALMTAGFLAWRVYLESTLSNIDSDIQKAEDLIASQDNESVKREVERNNAIVTDYNTFAEVNPQWSPILEDFARIVPDQVTITNFSANAKTGKIDISGVGATRDAVLALRENILASDKFRNVNLPLENLQKPTQTPFTYSFYLVQGILNESSGEITTISPETTEPLEE